MHEIQTKDEDEKWKTSSYIVMWKRAASLNKPIIKIKTSNFLSDSLRITRQKLLCHFTLTVPKYKNGTGLHGIIWRGHLSSICLCPEKQLCYTHTHTQFLSFHSNLVLWVLHGFTAACSWKHCLKHFQCDGVKAALWEPGSVIQHIDHWHQWQPHPRPKKK